MTPLPQDLEPYRKQAESLIKQGNIHAVEFSGRTYQINVFDPKVNESYWAFLHLTEPGEIADCFCLCSDETENDRCAHLAAGMLQIFNKMPEPLHKRYKESFWRYLGMVLEERGKKQAKSFLQAKNKEGAAFLKELYAKDVSPAEENSLKFSDLSEDELQNLRRGKINPVIRFEFSFWSDFAKYLLLLQENKHFPVITFKEVEGLPLDLLVETDLFKLEVRLTPKELESLIFSLLSVASPLKVRGGYADLIKSADLDQKTGCLILTHSDFTIADIKGIKIGGWIYQSGKGFFREEGDPNLKKDKISPKEMEAFLERYHRKLGPLMHEGLYERKAHLKFDKEGRLHFTHYLFVPGDICGKGVWKYGDWVWIPQKGFYRTLWPQDLPKEGIIKQNAVYEWIVTHQGFLADIEGFKVHLREMESTISWKLTEEGSLVFKSNLKGDFGDTSMEFGSFVYVKGEGFFSKSSFKEALAIQAGIEIPRHKVASYIRLNESELKLIPGFFIWKNPIEKAGVKLSLIDAKVMGQPIIELTDEFKLRPYQIFDDYLYVKDEGFFHLSEKHFIPHEWREERILPPSEFADFFGKKIEKLEPFIKEMDPRLMLPKKMKLHYDDGFYWEANGIKMPFQDFLKAFRSGKRFFFSALGRLDFHEERLQTLGKIFKESRYPEISLMEVLKLKAIEEVDFDLERFKKSRPLNINGLKSKLRPYQEIGLKWLWSLYCNDLSGLLCDDMGLGKTHQAMALVAACRNESKTPLKILVVCPTSVLYHWQEKMEQFLPGLKIVVYHGLKRSLKEFEEGEGVLLTSYGILRNEIKALKEFSFEIAIFDEIQVAKNHQSRLWVNLKEIQAKMTLGLTGTPIENHLRELKSLFDIALPSLMPSEADFVKLFVKPIERDESLPAKALLHRYIEPFLLRRKKEEVLFDLPEKIEEISHTDLLPSQKKLYEEVYRMAKESVLPELIDNNRVIPYIHIFALLSSLKKICDHPALYLKKVEDYKQYESGKWELFLELLSEAIGSEQKVVVFSHFLGMLDIIESHLTDEGIGYASLRGSTPNRREMIEKFQKIPECKVFVASLQAGGLGIDLTSASVVIHYDRWWNAARENQATDRVHRIGQTRGVQVFKLVTVGTIEDRIHALIEKKRKRMEEIVGGDEAQVIKTLTRDELIEIFQQDQE